ncbi:methyltransferase type 11 [Oculatella sp. LEGE 06141]|nr:methyltransferase type 11 [Oculatella sp. LEGE 06141]
MIWQLAQTLEKLGHLEQAEQYLHAVLKLMPAFYLAEEMLSRFQSAAKEKEVFATLSLTGFPSIEELEKIIRYYQQAPSDAARIEQLRQIRWDIAQKWLELPENQLQAMSQTALGQAHALLHGLERNGGNALKHLPLTAAEQQLIQETTAAIAAGVSNDRYIPGLLVAMLYCQAHELTWQHELDRLPEWLIHNYVLFVAAAQPLFSQVGEVDRYYRHMQQWVDYLYHNLSSQPESELWQEVALQFIQSTNCIPLYFSEANLNDLYAKRSDILELVLHHHGHQIDYQFSGRGSDREKIRLGILNTHFSPQTDTFQTLPVFEHLDRNRFEIVLYSLHINHHPLEQYCHSKADRVVQLSEHDIAESVQTIRADDLDLLLIGTNVTVSTNSVTLLATHRLARVQLAFGSAPVSTGIRNIDYFVSGNLSELEQGAQDSYRERLVTVDGTGYCFNYTVANQSPAAQPSRSSLGIDENTTVLVSGANFYKIVPELREAWGKLLAAIPDSVLMLYPFSPSWNSSYPSALWLQQMHQVLERYGVASNRLMILDTLPTREDVKAYLKLADIYLDSFRHSGGHSLVDALEVNLPTVVIEGNALRAKHAAAYLKELQLPELITCDETAYIEVATKLATSPEWRSQLSQRIRQAMQANPRFLDSQDYSCQLGNLFQQLFHTYQSDEFIKNFRLQTINFIVFPAWHQSEELLVQSLISTIKILAHSIQRDETTLLIDTTGIADEEADLALSSIAMHLLIEEEVDLSEGPELALVGELSRLDWKTLTSLLQGRISLEPENSEAIATAGTESLTIYSLEQLSS